MRVVIYRLHRMYQVQVSNEVEARSYLAERFVEAFADSK